jgi:hypothetical protein
MEFGQIASLADKISTVALVLAAMVAGARGIWVWGSVVKDRDKLLDKQDVRIAKLEAKVDAQERLIDRLSGIADRSTDLGAQLAGDRMRQRGSRS